MLIIDNDYLKIQIQEFGAELTSIFNKKDNIEHLWQADPMYWGWHAPVLFPVVGRCLNDTISIDGLNYLMEKHGFARKSTFIVVKKNEHQITLQLSSNENTLKLYPYKFQFDITYTLQDHELKISYSVKNIDDKDIFYSIGGHPAINAPFYTHEKYNDYYLEFPLDTSLKREFISIDGFFVGQHEEVLNGQHNLFLSDNLFENDALIFKKINSKKIYLKSINHKKYLSFSFDDFDYLGIWAKVGAPYVCIEPWLGCADTVDNKVDFKSKEGIQKVKEGESKKVSYSIAIHQ
jgi:galactose mutarotase-like enzyme